uniref:Uncharacterized protein n=1 Tax=Panagrolaimus sp. ES5 TaxID=591445 RepID=A0AC34GRM8_9BILA
MNRPNVLDGNRSRNMMLKDQSYASKPSPMENKNVMQRSNVTNTAASFASLSMNSNYSNPFMPILPRISDPPPMPVQPERQKSQPNI